VGAAASAFIGALNMLLDWWDSQEIMYLNETYSSTYLFTTFTLIIGGIDHFRREKRI